MEAGNRSFSAEPQKTEPETIRRMLYRACSRVCLKNKAYLKRYAAGMPGFQRGTPYNARLHEKTAAYSIAAGLGGRDAGISTGRAQG